MSDHYRLREEQRFIISRVVVPIRIAKARSYKIQHVEILHGRNLFIDGYNVLISVESILGEKPVYLCDDGFLRDVQGIFRSYRTSDLTAKALDEILDLLARACLANVEVLLDQQISMSGKLADRISRMMASHHLHGTARTAQDVDRHLKGLVGVIATADGNIIDSAVAVVDIPRCIAERRGLNPLSL